MPQRRGLNRPLHRARLPELGSLIREGLSEAEWQRFPLVHEGAVAEYRVASVPIAKSSLGD